MLQFGCGEKANECVRREKAEARFERSSCFRFPHLRDGIGRLNRPCRRDGGWAWRAIQRRRRNHSRGSRPGYRHAATLASTGTPAFFVHAADASHGDLGMITSDDVMLALSWSGETEELKDLINYSRRFRIALIAVTVNLESTLGKAADIVLVLPSAREACPHNLAPTTSSLMQLALGDALAIALLESRGFTAVDFGVFHPRGRLGAALKFVRDVMHPGDAVPLIARGVPMSEAIVEMSAKGFGCVAVIEATGKLAGVITDGDLRRHMRANLLQAMVDDVMTASPKTVRPDQLASEALQILNASKITALIVVEMDRPIGIVHFHDLLRAGVA